MTRAGLPRDRHFDARVVDLRLPPVPDPGVPHDAPVTGAFAARGHDLPTVVVCRLVFCPPRDGNLRIGGSL